jgi:cytochrome P450
MKLHPIFFSSVSQCHYFYSSNALCFSVIAGYETTSTALAYISYVLSNHSDIQQKLQEHIDANFYPENEHSMPSYETVMQMDYLDMFIRETLRMFPMIPIALTRRNVEDFHLKDIGTIPAGTAFTIDIYKLHFDPELWGPVDPNIFYPERFATKRHPMAWMPFGAGPRNCVGMRFALTELKLILVRFLKIYSIVSCGEQTQKPFENLSEFLVIKPNEVRVRIQRRDDHQD